MTKQREARTLLEVCVARGGYVRGARVCQFVVEWTLCQSDLDREPTVREFSRWWKGSERSAWRRMGDFREMFAPEGFDSPRPIAEHLIAEARKRPIGEGLRESQLMSSTWVMPAAA